MRQALRDLILRGAVTLTICALVALFVAGLLSVLADNLPTTAQTGAEANPGGSCRPPGCAPKGRSNGHRLATAKVQ